MRGRTAPTNLEGIEASLGQGMPQANERRAPPVVVLARETSKVFQVLQSLLDAGAILVVACDRESADAVLNGTPVEVSEPNGRRVVRRGDLEVDLVRYRAQWSGTPLDLTSHELEILAALCDRPGRVWTFAELLKAVWGTDFFGDCEAVHAAVKRLRRKLANAGVNMTIASVRGIGFRLAF
jgi:two-component system response regulator MtrA